MKLKRFAKLVLLCLGALICAFCFIIISLRSSDQLSGELTTTLSTHPEEYQTEKLAGVRVKKLPTVFIIGVKKGGSGALIEILKLHPQIAAPEYG